MRQYISTDDRLFREYMMAGGQVSDQTRIEWMQEKLTATATAEMEQHKVMLRTLGRASNTLLTDWLVYSNALIAVCSEVQDGSKQPAGQQAAAAAQPAAQPAGADKKKTAGRQITNEQVTAIHRYAASMGLEFREVSLEEVVEAPGGVAKYQKMTAAEAVKEYKDSLVPVTPARVPVLFPVLQKRSEVHSASSQQTYKEAVQACIIQTRGI